MPDKQNFPLIFESSSPGRRAYALPALDVPQAELPQGFVRQTPPALAEVAEIDYVRHYARLARRASGVDHVFYPLGSCTMKYNPKRHEDFAALPGFANLHPLIPAEGAQGALELLRSLEEALCELTGMQAVTLQPAAGAHGELTGLMLIDAYHRSRGQQRRTVLVPDSAHGTNPASAAALGFNVKEIPSDENGLVDLAALSAMVDEDTCALMLTCPNTLGLFEQQVQALTQTVHDAGALVYYDGANFNAIMGLSRPGDLGFDVVHLNLHKTMSTPHGGGGPGAGPIGVVDKLVPFLPCPRIGRDDQGKAMLISDCPDSIGRVKSFHGHFGVLVRAYAYIRTLGAEGLREVSENAILNANYLLAKLKDTFHTAFPGYCMHEFVISTQGLGVGATDVAKALIDAGYHPPTVHFPLIVKDALMVEPTETESMETLDAFADALLDIARRAKEKPDEIKHAPTTTPITRPDEVLAARKPIVIFPQQ